MKEISLTGLKLVPDITLSLTELRLHPDLLDAVRHAFQRADLLRSIHPSNVVQFPHPFTSVEDVG